MQWGGAPTGFHCDATGGAECVAASMVGYVCVCVVGGLGQTPSGRGVSAWAVKVCSRSCLQRTIVYIHHVYIDPCQPPYAPHTRVSPPTGQALWKLPKQPQGMQHNTTPTPLEAPPPTEPREMAHMIKKIDTLHSSTTTMPLPPSHHLRVCKRHCAMCCSRWMDMSRRCMMGCPPTACCL